MGKGNTYCMLSITQVSMYDFTTFIVEFNSESFMKNVYIYILEPFHPHYDLHNFFVKLLNFNMGNKKAEFNAY